MSIKKTLGILVLEIMYPITWNSEALCLIILVRVSHKY